MKAMRGQRGMSLVEATIILLVLMLLTGVIAPSITEFVNDAKRVKVKEDCEALGILTAYWVQAINCFQFNHNTGCTRSNRADILFSEGPDIGSSDLAGDAANAYSRPSTATINNATLNWDDDNSRGSSFQDQFTRNAPSYDNQFLFQSPKNVKPWPPIPPQTQSPVMSDPWGHRYVINSVFLATARDADNAGTGEGQRSGTWLRKVFCLSPGVNGLYETHFAGVKNTDQPGRPCAVDRDGDDYFYPIGCM